MNTDNSTSNGTREFKRLAMPILLGLLLATGMLWMVPLTKSAYFTAGLELTAQALAAVAPNLTITNLQPVSAQANENANTYNPGDPGAHVFMERIHNPYLLGENVRVNVDLDLRNDEVDFLHLDSMSVWYPGSPIEPAELAGGETLALPESMFTIPLGGNGPPLPLRKRSALANGGFGVTGLLLERKLTKDESLPFGTAQDILSYRTTDVRGYIAVGSREFMIGNGEGVTVDQIGLLRQGYIAKFKEDGFVGTSSMPQGVEELTALADLQDGRFLAAGRHSQASTGSSGFEGAINLTLHRVYELDDTGNWVDLDSIEQETESFGDEGLAIASFRDGQNLCEEAESVNIEVGAMGTVYLVAASLDCKEQKRGGLAAFDTNGDPRPAFGTAGVVVFAGPGGVPVQPVGAYKAFSGPSGRRGLQKEWLYLGAAVGEGCFGIASGCQFGLTRFDLLTGQHDAKFGWKLASMPNASDSRPYAMIKDSFSRFVLAGVAVGTSGPDTRLAMARFEIDGQLDFSFDGDGLLMHSFQGHDGEIRALTELPGGDLALAVLSLEEIDGHEYDSFGVARFDPTGVLVWEHSPYQSHSWTLHDLDFSLDYGYRRETQVSSTPRAITVDSRGRIVLAGIALSPRYEGSEGPVYLADPPTAPDPYTGVQSPIGFPGLQMTALARYLPFGQPDDRRWIRPGDKRRFIIPEDRDLTVSGSQPVEIVINLQFDGFDLYTIQRILDGHTNKVLNPSSGAVYSYPFPFSPSALNKGEAFWIKAHPLDHHHRNASSNRFAYDISVVRWDGSDWTAFEGDPPTSDDKENDDYLIFGRSVRAMADGEIVACRRNSPDNPPGEIVDSANYLQIQHAFNPILSSEREFVSYLHLKKNSIPENLCPTECPADEPGCFAPIPVTGGQFLGLAGNSGTSTAPHLHVHLSSGAPGANSYPLNFRKVIIGAPQSIFGNPQQPSQWFEVNGRSIPHETLLVPVP